MRKVIGALLLAMLVACGGDKATGPEAIAGTYTLRTVNGASVPAVVFQDSQEKDELTGGSISLNADKTWSGTLTAKVTDLTTGASGTFAAPANGTYTSNGGTITLTDSQDGSQLTGTVGGGTLTIGGDIGLGVVLTLVFKR
jgi:hypothetical protein